jgi:hypothetical protein
LLSCPSSIPLSTRSLNHLAGPARAHSHQRRSHWRKPGPGRQALLALADLRNGDTVNRLAAGFGVGAATAWRYVREAITLLASTTDDLTTAMARIRLTRGGRTDPGDSWSRRLAVRRGFGLARRRAIADGRRETDRGVRWRTGP